MKADLAVSVFFAVVCLVFPIYSPADRLTFPQMRGASYDEVRGIEALGRIVVAPDGQFFVCEWLRPCDWVPIEVGLLAAETARITGLPCVWNDIPPSQAMLRPLPGATHCLGDLSPDRNAVCFHELDGDDNAICVGVILPAHVHDYMPTTKGIISP